MIISDTSIKRPVLTLVGALKWLVVGPHYERDKGQRSTERNPA